MLLSDTTNILASAIGGSSKKIMSEYLTVEETAELLRLSARTVREKMRLGHFRLGVHYFKPGHSRPRFKRSALIEWIEGTTEKQRPQGLASEIDSTRIWMRRGYYLGEGSGEPIINRRSGPKTVGQGRRTNKK